MKRLSRKKLIIIVVVFALAVGSIYYFFIRDNQTQQQKEDSVAGQLDRENSLNQKTGNKKSDTSSDPDETPSGSLGQVTPVLTSVDSNDPVRAVGYVQGVFEDGGSCTYNFTNGSKTITRRSTGFKDATTTTCPPVEISTAEFNPKGSWNVTLQYKSSTSTGTSQEQKVIIN